MNNNNQKFIDEEIIPFLESKGLIVNDGGRKPYIMADGRLWALNAMFPNPKLMSVEDTVTDITPDYFVTRTTITLKYIDEDGQECTKVGSGVAGISKKSLNDYEKYSPVETCSTSSMGRALKNLGILCEWGATSDEIDKAKSEKAKSKSSDRVSEMDNGGDADPVVSDSDTPMVRRGRKAKEVASAVNTVNDQEGTAEMATDKQVNAVMNVLSQVGIEFKDVMDALNITTGLTKQFAMALIVDVQGYGRAQMDRESIMDEIINKWKGSN